MGQHPRRRCSVPYCPNPATTRGRCPTHAAAADHHRNTPNGTRRNDVYNTGRWAKLRATVLTEVAVCQYPRCHLAPTDVDHIIAINDGGDPWDRTNLQALCGRHHRAKTAAEVKARRRRG